MFALLDIPMYLNLLFFLNISNPHEDMSLCRMENVFISVVLIAAIFKIILAFSQYLKTFRGNILSKKIKENLSFFTLNFWNL